MVTAKKVLGKKFPEKKIETLFSRTFSLAPVWFHTKTSPEKSPIIVEDAWEQRMICKKGTINIKNTHGYIQNTDA